MHVPEILGTLVESGEMDISSLAKTINIPRQRLSNLLRWMELNELVRRTIIARSTLVSLGPKGEAVYSALNENWEMKERQTVLDKVDQLQVQVEKLREELDHTRRT